MSASAPAEWPYQQKLNIREIEKTPVSLLKFPLQITAPDYKSPETLPDTIEQVESLLHLKWLVEKYLLFMAKRRLARVSHRSAALHNLEPTNAHAVSSVLPQLMPSSLAYGGHVSHHGYSRVVAGRGGPMLASDQWLVPKPYDASVNINTERQPVSSRPTSATLTTPETPV